MVSFCHEAKFDTNALSLNSHVLLNMFTINVNNFVVSKETKTVALNGWRTLAATRRLLQNVQCALHRWQCLFLASACAFKKMLCQLSSLNATSIHQSLLILLHLLHWLQLATDTCCSSAALQQNSVVKTGVVIGVVSSSTQLSRTSQIASVGDVAACSDDDCKRRSMQKMGHMYCTRSGRQITKIAEYSKYHNEYGTLLIKKKAVHNSDHNYCTLLLQSLWYFFSLDSCVKLLNYLIKLFWLVTCFSSSALSVSSGKMVRWQEGQVKPAPETLFCETRPNLEDLRKTKLYYNH